MMSPIGPKLKVALVGHEDGSVLSVLGDRLLVKLTGEMTGNGFALFDVIVPPGGGPPRHFHLHEDELFIVKQGTLEVWMDGRWCILKRDDITFAPRGSIHTYRNNSDQPCQFWMLATPAGIESLFSRVDRECFEKTSLDAEKVSRLCQQHGIHLVPVEKAGE